MSLLRRCTLLKYNYVILAELKTTQGQADVFQFSSVQFSHSVMSDSLRPVNRSTPGLPVHHQLPEFTETHVHRVSDAIQPSHPLSSPSPPAPSPSQLMSLGNIYSIRWQKVSTAVICEKMLVPLINFCSVRS